MSGQYSVMAGQITAVSNRWTELLEWTTGMDYWNGLLEWTTGMDFDFFFFFFSPRATIYIEELV